MHATPPSFPLSPLSLSLSLSLCHAGVPLTMVPLEVTHTALATRDVLACMFSRHGAGARPSPFLALVQQLLTFFETAYREVFKFADGAPLHDPCAVAAVLAPELFEVTAWLVQC